MRAVRTAAILLTEVVAVDALYGIGVRLGGNPFYAAAALAVMVTAAAVIGRTTGYVVAAILSLSAFCVAFLVAINIWGT